MRRSMTGRLVLMLALLSGAAGCDSGDSNTTPTPTTPTPTVTETFAGSLGVNGAATFTFNTSAAGTVTATLRNVSPSVQLGLGLGTWNGVICQIVLANDLTTPGTSVTGSVSGAGSLCVRVHDIGQVTQTTTFEVVVVHP